MCEESLDCSQSKDYLLFFRAISEILIINTKSLFEIVNTVNEAFFFDRPISKAERERLALLIASRQGEPGCYAEMFAPFPQEAAFGARLFTGEPIRPSASLRHVAGEEGCRALILLKSASPKAKEALKRATLGMSSRISHFQPNNAGLFCCGTCDPALWRHIAVGGLKGMERWVEIGLKSLRRHRDSEGGWRRFPFFYTLLALTELEYPAAVRELKYVAPVCEKYLMRKGSGQTAERRRAVVARALERI